jgi:hypothetical protein
MKELDEASSVQLPYPYSMIARLSTFRLRKN